MLNYHSFLCFGYIILCFLFQFYQVKTTTLFYSVYPVSVLYYSVLSIPSIHKIHVYNLKFRTVPKWNLFYRLYFHAVLLHECAISTSLILFGISLWRDLRFVIFHAEERLKSIDMALYENDESKHLRIAHLHLNMIKDDSVGRNHQNHFNENKLHIVRHSLRSEEFQNGMLNYEKYRKKNKFPPKRNNEEEQKMWQASYYNKCFIQYREIFTFWPFLFLFVFSFACFNRLKITSAMNTTLLIADTLGIFFKAYLPIEMLYLSAATVALIVSILTRT